MIVTGLPWQNWTALGPRSIPLPCGSRSTARSRIPICWHPYRFRGGAWCGEAWGRWVLRPPWRCSSGPRLPSAQIAPRTHSLRRPPTACASFPVRSVWSSRMGPSRNPGTGAKSRSHSPTRNVAYACSPVNCMYPWQRIPCVLLSSMPAAWQCAPWERLSRSGEVPIQSMSWLPKATYNSNTCRPEREIPSSYR